MNKVFRIVMVFSFLIIHYSSYSQKKNEPKFETPYGNNENVGKYIMVNGIKMYYEEYGTGQPMFLIHGNGGSVKSMRNQIEYFRKKYRVIIADNRGQGKSELKTDSLTYVQIAKDWAELANQLKIDSVNVIGWSDGGIIGLLMGINHPRYVKKVVAMGANMRPDTTAVYPWAVNSVTKSLEEAKNKIKIGDTTKNWNAAKQLLNLLANQPTISKSDLSKIKAPVLVIAGDKDIIREEHTVEMYQGIPNAHLCIMPGETHYTPGRNPELFNAISEKFIKEPFTRPDSDWTKRRKKKK